MDGKDRGLQSGRYSGITQSAKPARGVYSPQEPYSDRSPLEEEQAAAVVAEPEQGLDYDVGKLHRSIEGSYRSLGDYRKVNSHLIKEFAGTHYQQNNQRKNQYINLMNQAVETYQMLLAANRPRVMVSTHHPQHKAFAKHFQQAVNALIKEIRLEDTIQKWVLDAFFCVGIVKTHLADSGLVELEPDVWMDPGNPFASNVSLDNFVYDMGAKKWSEVKYAADMYRIPFADIERGVAEGIYDAAAVTDLSPTSKYSHDDERVEQISRGYDTDPDEFEPMIDLADVWVRRDGMIYTFAVSNRDMFQLMGDPIASMPWDADEEGPYHLFGFGEVPENIMPLSPSSQLELLHTLINNLMRKSARQAQRQKTVNLYTPAGAGSAKRLQSASDGEWIEVQDPREIGSVNNGGVDQGTYGFLLGNMDQFDRMAGNLRAIAGLGAQTDTVGQEKLVHEAAGNKEGFMRGQVAKAVTRLVKSLGKMLWADEFKTMSMEIPVDGAEGYAATATWEPGDREGDFLDYNFDIDIYSMQYQSPQAKVQTMNGLMQSIYVPLMEMLMQQGGMVDLFKLTHIYADLLNLPELNEVVKFANTQPADGERPGPINRIPKSPNSTRNYVRHNVSSGQSPGEQALRMMGQQTGAQGGTSPAT